MTLNWRLAESPFVLSGEVCSIHVKVSMDGELEDQAWHLLGENRYRGKLQSELLAAIHQSMGPEFDLRHMTFGRGTIEIVVTIGAVYYAVSRYKNFVESIELFVSQVAGVVKRFLENSMPMPAPPTVAATWQPGAALVRRGVRSDQRDTDWAYPLLWYVIASHAGLLALFIWMLARR
jgi:hypothetical protein